MLCTMTLNSWQVLLGFKCECFHTVLLTALDLLPGLDGTVVFIFFSCPFFLSWSRFCFSLLSLVGFSQVTVSSLPVPKATGCWISGVLVGPRLDRNSWGYEHVVATGTLECGECWDSEIVTQNIWTVISVKEHSLLNTHHKTGCSGPEKRTQESNCGTSLFLGQAFYRKNKV